MKTGKLRGLLAGALACMSLFNASVCVASGDAIPGWSYAYLKHLEQRGWLVLPENYQDLDRLALSRVVAQGLEQQRKRYLADSIAVAHNYNSYSIREERLLLEKNGAQEAYSNPQEKSMIAERHRLVGKLCAQIAEAVTKNDIDRINQLKEAQQEIGNKLEIAAAELVEERLAKLGSKTTIEPQELAKLKKEYALICRLEAEDYVQLQISEAQMKAIERFPAKCTEAQKAAVSAQYQLQVNRLHGWQWKRQQLWQAMTDMEQVDRAMTDMEQADREMSELRAEFGPELAQQEWFQQERANTLSIAPISSLADFWDDEANGINTTMVNNLANPAHVRKLNVDGEIRLEYGNYTGFSNRSRLRMRLYPDFNIDGNWHFKSMLNFERKLSGTWNSSSKVFDRWYLEGKAANCLWDIGAFGVNWAEGNIYDSKFTGIQASTLKTPVKLTVAYGEINHAKNAAAVTASYPIGASRIEAGFYTFRSDWENGTRRIGMLNYRHQSGNFNLGAMLLKGSGAGLPGGHTGYVFTVEESFGNSWETGGESVYVKYYRQPASTYYSHTMNSMVDMMGGFKGLGIGYTRNLNKDLVCQLEYSNLQDLQSGRHNQGIWLALNYFFSTRNNH